MLNLERAKKIIVSHVEPLIKAFSKTGQAIKDYEHKGKYIVWDMKKEGKNFSGGKIKDYSDGRVYNSKMEIISKNKIGVSGCVLFICQSQEWNKLNSFLNSWRPTL